MAGFTSASPKDTYEAALEQMLQVIAKSKTLPDVNLPFVVEMETKILEQYRSPERRMQQAGLIPQGGQNPAGNAALGLPGLGGGGPGPMPMGGPPMPPGPMPGSAPPPSMLGAGVPGVPPAPPMPGGPNEVAALLAGAGGAPA